MAGILSLPESTVLKLGSSLSLLDPSSLVKELVENALDANATLIAVDISSNSLDKIRVRDNGFGIDPNDRGMLCKRHCTSKIRDMSDLESIGGRSLGFRGEALASAAALSTKLTMTTRVEGEKTAVAIDFDHTGSKKNETPTSHGIGTTVEVRNFLSNLPVRKQTVEKSPHRMLSKIKDVLQRIALARPNARYSLKVLKQEGKNAGFDFIPIKNSSSDQQVMSDAVGKVFGRKTLECCTWVSFPEKQVPDRNAIISVHGLVVSPTTSDSSLVTNQGQYVSVDARPISCNSGVFKDILSHYKTCLKRSIPILGNKRNLDPFLYLHVECTSTSYDVNIEPSKDVIMFHDALEILQNVQDLLDSIYLTFDLPEDAPDSDPIPDKQNHGQGNLSVDPEKFVPTTRYGEEKIGNLSENTPVKQAPKPNPQDIIQNMLRRYDEDTEPPVADNAASDSQPEEGESLRDASISNPWVFAKLHCSRKSGPPEGSPYLPTPARQRGDVDDRLSEESETCFPYPLVARKKKSSDTDQSDQLTRISSPAGLDRWFEPTQLASPRRTQTVSLTRLSAQDFDPTPLTLSGIPASNGRTLRSILKPPPNPQKTSARHIPPDPLNSDPIAEDDGPVWFEYGHRKSRNAIQHTTPSSRPNQAALDLREPEHPSPSPAIPGPPIHPDLAATLDYEARKQFATTQHRENLRRERKAAAKLALAESSQSQTALDTSSVPCSTRPTATAVIQSPHRNRYNAARNALHPTPIPLSQLDPAATNNSSTVHGHPAPPLPTEPSKNPRTLRRTRGQDAVIDLVLALSIGLEEITSEHRRAAECDDYIVDQGVIGSSLETLAEDGDDAGIREAERTLGLVWERYLRGFIDERDVQGWAVEFDVSGSLREDRGGVVIEKGGEVSL